MIFTQEAPLTRRWFSGRSCIRSNWNLEMLIFEERGKPENPEKKLSEQSKQPTTSLTHSRPEPRPRRWEASAITTTPALLPKLFRRFGSRDIFLGIGDITVLLIWLGTVDPVGKKRFTMLVINGNCKCRHCFTIQVRNAGSDAHDFA